MFSRKSAPYVRFWSSHGPRIDVRKLKTVPCLWVFRIIGYDLGVWDWVGQSVMSAPTRVSVTSLRIS